MTVPRPILLFAAAYALLVLINLVHNAISPESLPENLQGVADWLGAGFVPTLLAFRTIFATWIGWLIVCRASNIARWFFVLLLASRLFRGGAAWTGLLTANLNSILWSIGTCAGLLALVCLFLPASRFWFATKGRSMGTDAAIFE